MIRKTPSPDKRFFAVRALTDHVSVTQRFAPTSVKVILQGNESEGLSGVIVIGKLLSFPSILCRVS